MKWTRTLVGIILLGVSGCGQTSLRSHGSANPTSLSCVILSTSTAKNLADCKTQAEVYHRADAAKEVGSHYWDRSGKDYDPTQAVIWYEKAAQLGDLGAYKTLFDAYFWGSGAPRNEIKADQYLDRAALAGAEWAQLILASRAERTDPAKALEAYLSLARNDNCHAQARLASAYKDGDLTNRNWTQAYFWALLAEVGGMARRSPNHAAAQLKDSSGFVELCRGLISMRIDLESYLPPTFRYRAQDAASTWRRGQQEPSLLPAPLNRPGDTTPTPPVAKNSPPAAVPKPAIATSTFIRQPGWRPLSATGQRPAVVGAMDARALFGVVSRSVWLVVAARSVDDLETRTSVALGSAVAVTDQELVTNCHVIEDRSLIYIKQGETIHPARLLAREEHTDRCILSSNGVQLVPVKGVRKYDDLQVGEDVFTVGSPSGLEATLGHGIISGLRSLDRQRLVQTTAHISPGSSGGGLFDRSGNLIGITTFRLREAQGLNFAIAAEDYFR